MKQTIGQKISPILIEVENTLWEFEEYKGTKPDFTIEGLRAAAKIMMAVLMDKMYELQDKENMPQEQREEMASAAGSEFRKLIKTYTGIDTHNLYK